MTNDHPPSRDHVCQHGLLARSPVGQVAVCPDCGVVHLSLTCLSVRLETEAFQALAIMVAEAQARLLQAQGRAQAARSAVACAAPSAAMH